MRNRIAASIQLTFCFSNHNLRVKFVDDLALGLIRCIEDGKVHFGVSCDSGQRFCSLIGWFFEHPVKLATSAFFAGKVLIFLVWIIRRMGVGIALGMDQLMSKDVGNDHLLDQSRLEQIANTN